MQAELIVDARNATGESPVWDVAEQALYWVDILTPSVHCHRGPGLNTSTPLGSMVSVAVPKTSGGLLLATPSGLMGWPAPQEPLEWFLVYASNRSFS